MSVTDLVRRQPHSLEAEQTVLGSLLSTPVLLPDVQPIVADDAFYNPRHILIYGAMVALSEQGKPVETPAVIDLLRHTGDLEKAGGAEYIVHLYSHSSPHNVMYYAEVLAEKYRKRQLIALHLDGLQAAQDGSGMDASELLAVAQSSMDVIGEEVASGDVVRVGASMEETFDKIEALGNGDGVTAGIPSGFHDLDRLCSGFAPGQMVVVAGRPGMGKSTLAMDFVRSAAIRHNEPVLFASLEMSREEINMRLLSAECGVELRRLREGKLTESDWERVARKQQAIMDGPIFVNDSADQSIDSIIANARRIKQREGRLGMVVIDYLQLAPTPSGSESRQLAVSDMSRRCKLGAKELEVPFVVLSQLNRGAESRADNRPMVSDLRESGSIEQDADMVLLVHREEVYEPETTRAGEADIIVGKQRNGPTGTAILLWQGKYSRFADFARDE